MSSRRLRDLGVACLSLASVFVPAAALAASADYFLKIEGVKGESKDAKHKGEIEIQSFSWGATQRDGGGQADALTDGLMIIRYASDPPPQAAGAAAGGTSGPGGAAGGGAAGTGLGSGKVSVKDMSVMRGPRQSTSVDGSVTDAGGADSAAAAAAAGGKFGAVSGVRRDDNLASVKRTHPALVKITKPLETGSISLNMKLAGCAVGKRYPSAVLSTPRGLYTLLDIVVASCDAGSGGGAPTEQVTLNYAKVKVRGWDPEKKED